VLNQVVRSDWLNVRDLGAVGDGKHDDTSATQKAMDMLTTDANYPDAGKPGQHLTLYFPPGDFLTTRTLELGSNKTAHHAGGLQWVSLIGHGAATKIVWGGRQRQRVDALVQRLHALPCRGPEFRR
jgi:polygalacturonase